MPPERFSVGKTRRDAETMTIFKQYGEQRTGTNYLKRLIELNFTDVLVFGSVLGWKHGM
jgi:hypothetical protein